MPQENWKEEKYTSIKIALIMRITTVCVYVCVRKREMESEWMK